MNYLENLKVLRQAVQDEPERLFSLRHFAWQNTCGTLHCTAGLAATLPYFQQMGLYLMPTEFGHSEPRIDGLPVDDAQLKLDAALNHLFKPYPDADMPDGAGAFEYLFDDYGDALWDSDIFDEHELGDSMGHKQLALARLDRAIAEWEKA